MQKQAENKDSHLARLVKELQEQVQTMTKQKEQMQGEWEAAMTTVTKQRELNMSLESEVRILRGTLVDREGENSELRSKVQTQELCIESLKESLTRHSVTEAELANKLMCLKSELLGTNRSLQEYRVVKINPFLNAQVKLTFGQGNEGVKVLILEYKNKQDVHDLTMVEKVAMRESKGNRFTIAVAGEELEFESDEAEKVVRSLNAMMGL